MEAATIRVFSSSGFLTGLCVGFVVLAAGVILAVVTHRRNIPVGGVLIAAGFLAALEIRYGVATGVWVAAGLLIAAGLVGSLGKLARGPALLLALGGAWMLSVAVRDAVPSGRVPVGELVPWFPWFVFVAVPVVGVLVSDFDRRNGAPSIPLSGITVLGLFFLVPDTELARVLLGVALPAMVLGWPWPAARLGAPGAYAIAGILLWAAAIDGRGVPAALIVVIACFGLLVSEPLSRLVVGSRAPKQWRPSLWVVAGIVQLATATAASRLLPSGVSLMGAAVFTLALLLIAGALFHLFRARLGSRDGWSG